MLIFTKKIKSDPKTMSHLILIHLRIPIYSQGSFESTRFLPEEQSGQECCFGLVFTGPHMTLPSMLMPGLDIVDYCSPSSLLPRVRFGIMDSSSTENIIIHSKSHTKLSNSRMQILSSIGFQGAQLALCIFQFYICGFNKKYFRNVSITISLPFPFQFLLLKQCGYVSTCSEG